MHCTIANFHLLEQAGFSVNEDQKIDCDYSCIWVFRYSGTWVLGYTGTQVLRYSATRVLGYSGTRVTGY